MKLTTAVQAYVTMKDARFTVEPLREELEDLEMRYFLAYQMDQMFR